ncbi:MAG TPA: CAP domain-containing protein [Candidatus Limnocylindria bacterium]|jgi:uncharacterized protein YkwD|nr:CAP domain-containing protein [Candidatus Limnocylindria bacterium]
MESLMRRLVPVVVILAILAVAVPQPAAAAQQPSSGEAYLLRLVNKARTGQGLRPLRWDKRLADVAQARSNDMAANSYFAHLTSGKLASMVDAEGIKWWRLGENLARNTYSSVTTSAEVAMRGWRNSSGHWALLTNAEYNYIAIGGARGVDGWYYWTALLIKGPDRTPPKSRMLDSRLGSLSSGTRTTRISWTGHDVKLSSLTAGLRDFKLQRKVGTNGWKTVTNWTTATAKSFGLRAGKTYRFRVQARDWKGNKSRWSAAIVVKP